MDFRSLQCLIAVAEERHFGRAAKRLNLTQPALSQRIAALEAQIGHSLLVRGQGPIRPTDAGVAMIRRARVALANVEAAHLDARLAATGKLGRIKVGFTQIALYEFVPELIRRFRAEYPDVEIELNELNSPSQEQQIVDGRIDVGLVHPPLSFAELDSELLCEVKLVLALPSEWPQSGRRQLKLSACAEMPFLLAPRSVGPMFYDRIIAACRANGFSPRVVQEVTPMSTLIGLAASGIGAGFVARSLMSLQRPGAAYVRVSGNLPTLPIAVAWRRDSINPVIKRFIEIAAACASR
jgi:DNA-binding transcriptional LysR family regulator